ncbi:potassium efflux system protein [Pedobacter sp. UYP30]|uniref:mechanosensitive ion channel family protein n=1 Tax=Pedobacter sp. UYP30 TaxID=1756400 RepID=UPI00339A211F
MKKKRVVVNLSQYFKCSLLSLCFLMLSHSVMAQQLADTVKGGIDSAKLTKLTFNSDSVRKYFKASDTLVAYQLSKVEQYTLKFNKINSELKRGFDTKDINKGLPINDTIIGIAKLNLVGLKRHASLKILYNTKALLLDQNENLYKWQKQLSIINDQLNDKKDHVTEFRGDEKLLLMPTDSVLFIAYVTKLRLLGEKVDVADSGLTAQLKQLGVLQNTISSNFLTVSDLLNETDYQISTFSSLVLENEFGYIWNHKYDPANKRDFKTVVKRSLSESKTLLDIYGDTNWIPRIIVIIAALLFYFIMQRNIRRIKKQSEAPEIVFAKTKHIVGNVFLATVVFSLLIVPFVYGTAPQAFTLSLWGLQIIALSILLRKKLNYISGLQLAILLALFYTTGFANLLIETTYTERWIQVAISIISIGLSFWMISKREQNYFAGKKYFRPLLMLFLVMNILALLLNVIGRVTLAKVLNTGANYGMIAAITLFILVEILIDAIFLSMEASKKTSRLTAYFQYNGMEKQITRFLGLFAILLWILVFTNSIHLYDYIFGNIVTFLSAEQQLGNVTFTFGNIALFIFIIWISTILAQMTSFIFGNVDDNIQAAKSRLGSTVLLVRLVILSIGIFLAFVVSGIPLDKITIIIGALGVGIGFGLQNIVNNLVSGIIIAFEKPIQIGDLIEVGTRTGYVKEVGIRSSKLNTFEGSEIIIPNGDLLAQHLINWTRNNQNRRITINVGVGYGSNMDEVEEIVNRLLAEHSGVHKLPEPTIFIESFADNAVAVSVFFWTDVNGWLIVKAAIYKAIYNAFNEAGIDISIPQRDLYIRSLPDNLNFGGLEKPKKEA